MEPLHDPEKLKSAFSRDNLVDIEKCDPVKYLYIALDPNGASKKKDIDNTSDYAYVIAFFEKGRMVVRIYIYITYIYLREKEKKKYVYCVDSPTTFR